MTWNANRRYQMVPRSWCQRSLDFGLAMVAHYANGGSAASRSRSGDRGTESNPRRQAQGKIGEVAFSLLCGLDPERSVQWDLEGGPSYDVLLPAGQRLDIKTTFPPYRLIWSNNINDIYADKHFDYLVSVSIEEHDFRQCWIEGFVSKQDFYDHKRIADSSQGGRLEPGTWFMPKAKLGNIDDLIALGFVRAVA